MKLRFLPALLGAGIATTLAFHATAAEPAPLPVDESLAPIVQSLPGGRSVKVVKCYPKGLMRAYCVSFDDGRLEWDKPVIETLRKHGMKATFFLNSLHPQSQDALQHPDEYAGFEIASHSAHHKGFGKMPLEMAKDEIVQDQTILGDKFHFKVGGFAYAYGDFPKDPEVLAKLNQTMTELGIAYARYCGATNAFRPPQDFHHWVPDCGLGGGSLKTLDRYLQLPADDSVRSMMEFAHAVDFPKGLIAPNIWDEYLTRISKSPEIWNPTMLDLAHYVTALRALAVTDAGIQNKAAIPVWVRIDGKPVEIPAGATHAW